jgi:hypothetical protein
MSPSGTQAIFKIQIIRKAVAALASATEVSLQAVMLVRPNARQLCMPSAHSMGGDAPTFTYISSTAAAAAAAAAAPSSLKLLVRSHNSS